MGTSIYVLLTLRRISALAGCYAQINLGRAMARRICFHFYVPNTTSYLAGHVVVNHN